MYRYTNMYSQKLSAQISCGFKIVVKLGVGMQKFKTPFTVRTSLTRRHKVFDTAPSPGHRLSRSDTLAFDTGISKISLKNQNSDNKRNFPMILHTAYSKTI